jgi:hypothetical protein
MRVAKIAIGLIVTLTSMPAKALDLNEAIEYLTGDKEYAAYECLSLGEAETCGTTCKAWTEKKISFKIDELRNQLVIKWINQFETVAKCSILNKRNWQCSTHQMTYKMQNGHVTRTHIVPSIAYGGGAYYAYACFK